MSGELPEKALAVEFILRCVVSDNQEQADGLIANLAHSVLDGYAPSPHPACKCSACELRDALASLPPTEERK